MSDFWATRLGVAAPAAPPAQAQPVPGYMPSPYYTAPVQPQVPQQVPGQPNPYQVPQEPLQAPSKAVSARSAERCPECGSGDYFKPHGIPNAMYQCYTCGYNPRFAHSTAGAGMPSGEGGGGATPARQVGIGSGGGGRNNFNPQTVVDKVPY